MVYYPMVCGAAALSDCQFFPALRSPFLWIPVGRTLLSWYKIRLLSSRTGINSGFHILSDLIKSLPTGDKHDACHPIEASQRETEAHHPTAL